MLLHGCDSMQSKDCKKWGLFKTQVLLCKLSTCSIEWQHDAPHLCITWTSTCYCAPFNAKKCPTNSLSMNGKGSSKLHWQSNWTSKIFHFYSSLASKDFATKQCAPPLTPHFQKLLSAQCENSPNKKGKEKKTLPPICAVFMWICDVRSDCCL